MQRKNFGTNFPLSFSFILCVKILRESERLSERISIFLCSDFYALTCSFEITTFSVLFSCIAMLSSLNSLNFYRFLRSREKIAQEKKSLNILLTQSMKNFSLTPTSYRDYCRSIQNRAVNVKEKKKKSQKKNKKFVSNEKRKIVKDF